MKRRIISVLAGIFAIAVFTGCQQPAQSSDSGTDAKNSNTEVKETETNGFEGTSWKYTDEYGDTWTLRFTSESEGTLTIKYKNGGSSVGDVNYTATSSFEANIGVSFADSYSKGTAVIVGKKIELYDVVGYDEVVLTKQ